MTLPSFITDLVSEQTLDRGLWGVAGAVVMGFFGFLKQKEKSRPDLLNAAAHNLEAAGKMATSTFSQLRAEIASKAEEIDRLRDSLAHLSEAVDSLETQAEAKDHYILVLQALLHDAGIDYPALDISKGS